MGVVTTLPRSRPLTWRDLQQMPDDGHRYELLDGSLLVTPAPVSAHQRAVVRLIMVLAPACPEDLEVFTAPFDVRLAEDTVLQPDVLVARRSDVTRANLPAAPVLAVEVLAPSTRLIDLNLKKARYEAAGCPSYWVVDPDVPSITAWQVRSGSYVQARQVAGDDAFEVDLPFPVGVVPSGLVR